MTAKTWGPFTGRQLTAMFVALMVGAVMIPSAAWAVDEFTNVAIQDPVSGYKAKVYSGGNIRVSDAAGPMTVDGTVSVSTSKASPLNVQPVGRPWQVGKTIPVDAGATSSCITSFPYAPSGTGVFLRSAHASTGFGSKFDRIYLAAMYDAGGVTKALSVAFPPLDAAVWSARIPDMDLIYVGGPQQVGIQTLYLCWTRPSGLPAASLQVVLSGELFTL